MTEYDYWKIFPRMPKRVTIGDITVRDGFQHEEKFISTQAKKFYLEELIFAGCRNIEVTNLGNPFLMPQFRDAEELLTHLRSDRFKQRCAKKGVNYDDITFTAITIREGAVNRAVALREKGIGPDRLLMMVPPRKSIILQTPVRRCRITGPRPSVVSKSVMMPV